MAGRPDQWQTVWHQLPAVTAELSENKTKDYTFWR